MTLNSLLPAQTNQEALAAKTVASFLDDPIYSVKAYWFYFKHFLHKYLKTLQVQTFFNAVRVIL